MNLADGFPHAANFLCFSRFPPIERSASVGRTCCEKPFDQANRNDGANYRASDKSAGDTKRMQRIRDLRGQTHIKPVEIKTQTPAAGKPCVGKCRRDENGGQPGSPTVRPSTSLDLIENGIRYRPQSQSLRGNSASERRVLVR